MPSPVFFKEPTPLELTRRLREKLGAFRQQWWKLYVKQMSQAYQAPCQDHGKLDHYLHLVKASESDLFRDPDDSELYLNFNKIREKIGDDCTAYVLFQTANQEDVVSFVTIPPRGHDTYGYVPVIEEEEKQKLKNLIDSKPNSYRVANDEEMDGILSIIHKNGAEPLEKPGRVNYPFKVVSYYYKFNVAHHAPYLYAIKRNMLVGTLRTRQIEHKMRLLEQDPLGFDINTINNQEENISIAETKKLLNSSWFLHEKDEFSWYSLIDWSSPLPATLISMVSHELSYYNHIFVKACLLERELTKKVPDITNALKLLNEIKTFEMKNKDVNLNWSNHERDNIFIKLVKALSGVVSAPIALGIGLICMLPAACLGSPYFGTSQFILDAMLWFLDSTITAMQCILFPIAMIHAQNTTGSYDVLKGECSRLADRLSEILSTKDPINEQAITIR